MVTDKLKSYAAARREVMPDVVHREQGYANNRYARTRTTNARVQVTASRTTNSVRPCTRAKFLSRWTSLDKRDELSVVARTRVRDVATGDVRLK